LPQDLSKPRADAFVDRYVTSDLPLRDIAESETDASSPAATALLLIEDCLGGRRLARDALQVAERVPIKGTDPELLVLTLSRWAELSCRIGRPSEARALIHRAMALVSEDTHPEIRANAILVQSILADTTGDKATRERLLRETIDLLPPHSPRRKFYVWELALFLAQQGRGVESADHIKELSWQCNDQFHIGSVFLLQFINSVETGAVRQAVRLVSQVDSPPGHHRDLSAMYRGYRALLRLMNESGMGGRSDKDDDDYRGDPAWIRVVRSLLAADADEALRLARLDANKLLGSIFATGFDAFNLVRAELSTGTWEGASRLLRMREARGNRHYLDDLFLARAELLAGNRKSAAAHFAEALKAARYYQARERIDFELRLSCELSRGDIVELTRSAGRQRRPRRPPAATPARVQPQPAEGQPGGTELILGKTAAIGDIRKAARKFADLDAPLLITGETGTGKDLMASVIHQVSSRNKHPFIPVNCASITETLLESELFGHERGAFTGAEKASKGLFEEAGAGTILLDEIGDISPRLQRTLLRVLETGEIRAVGSARTRKINCRIIAATNADLERRAEEGLFRKDLLFRLHRLGIHIPPLRERREDILLLVRHFLDTGRSVGIHATLSEDLAATIRSYDWPGNVRELRNVVERMRLMHSDKTAYTLADLDLKFQAQEEADHPGRARAEVVASPPTPDSRPVQEPRGNLPARMERGMEVPSPAMDVDRILRTGTSQLRRTERLRELFQEYKKLTRREIMEILGISPNTATKYLNALCEEGYIVRVMPSASTRSHYFELRKEAASEKT